MKKSSIVAWILIGIDIVGSLITSLSSNNYLYQTPSLSFDSFDHFLLSFFFFIGKHLLATIGVLILLIGLISRKTREIRTQRQADREDASAELPQVPEKHTDPTIESPEILLPAKKEKRPRTKRNLKPLWISLISIGVIIILSLTADLIYTKGQRSGYDSGYTAGVESTQQISYDNGYSIGFKEGYDVGFEKGYDGGLNVGKHKGYTQGVYDGRDDVADYYYDTGQFPHWMFR